MAELIEKILERLEADIFFFDSNIGIAPNIKIGLEIAKEIVQEVAKEYGKDTNVRSYEDGYADGWNDCSHTKAYQKGE